MQSSQAPTVLSVWPRVIVADLRKHGRNIEAVLDEVDLTLRTVNREGGRIPWEAQAKLIDITARELADDLYGLHLASNVDVRDIGVLSYVGLASRTVGDALANLARYVQVFNEALRFDLSTEDGATIVSITAADPSLLRYRQQMEFGVGLLLNAYRFFTKQQVVPLEVRFVHARRDKLREVSCYFGCKVSYLQSRHQLVLKASDMAIPIPTADHRLLKILRAHGDSILKQHGTRDAGLLRRVEHQIMELLPKGAAKAKVIAADLGVSERTLTRQLAALGTSFNEVLDRFRKQLALKYVREADVSLTEISFLLGYANQPAFNLAFKRWTGQAPSALPA